MNDEKQLIIHFNNGTKMEVSFPTQIKNSPGAVIVVTKKILEDDKLTIQTNERVIVIPWSSIKYLEASAMSATTLPMGTIKGARIVASNEARRIDNAND